MLWVSILFQKLGSYGQDGGNPDVASNGVLDGSCGYGALDRSEWPNWMAAAIGPSNPLTSGGNPGGCGACVEVTCTSVSILTIFIQCFANESRKMPQLLNAVSVCSVNTYDSFPFFDSYTDMHARLAMILFLWKLRSWCLISEAHSQFLCRRHFQLETCWASIFDFKKKSLKVCTSCSWQPKP